jgi:hypothetical protein
MAIPASASAWTTDAAAARPAPDRTILDTPVRRLRLTCAAARPFAFPAAGTLEPYYILRGLIGGALTARSRELERALFKPEPLRDLGGSEHSEIPGTPWRLRLSHLYGREIDRRFDIVVDLLGEEPCERFAELIDAVRLAGSGAAHRDWRSGGRRRWGLQIPASQTPVTFTVVDAEVRAPERVRDRCEAAAAHWREAREALLVFRTLTILRERVDGGRGAPLAMTGEVDATALARNALRRLAVIDAATRRHPAERTRSRLRAMLAEQGRVIAALAAEFPLRCTDAVTVPIEWSIGRQRTMRGLIGSARLNGSLEPWCAGLTACELLGVGESTAYGAGQVACVPLR